MHSVLIAAYYQVLIMKKKKTHLFRMCKLSTREKERGASLVEYGLLIALIAVIGIPAVKVLGQNINVNMVSVADEIGAGSLTPCDPFAGPCPP